MTGKPPKGRRLPKSKIFWTDDERAQITRQAVDLMEVDAGLTGLALLRAALEALPEERRRGLIALSQAPWFTRMTRDEVERRDMERKAQDDAVGVLREQRTHHNIWMDEQLSRIDRMLPLFETTAHAAEEHRQAFAKMMTNDEEWRQKTLEFNQKALELLAKNAQANEAQAERIAKIEEMQARSAEALTADRQEMIRLLGQLCAEVHDLNVRLTEVKPR